MLTSLIETLMSSGTIVGIIASLLTAFGLYFGGKKVGRSEAEIKSAHEKSAAAIQSAQEAVTDVIHVSEITKNVDSQINNAVPGSAAVRLRNEWDRDETGPADDNKSN